MKLPEIERCRFFVSEIEDADPNEAYVVSAVDYIHATVYMAHAHKKRETKKVLDDLAKDILKDRKAASKKIRIS